MSEPAQDPPDPFEHTRMTLGEHLDELRKRLVRGMAALAIVFAVAWAFKDGLAEVVMDPFLTAARRINSHWSGHYEALLAEEPELDPADYFQLTPAGEIRRNARGEGVLASERRIEPRLQAISPTEPFLFALRVCFYCALVFGGPVLLWQLWQFVAAGLYQHERRSALRYFPWSVLLFAAGVLFGYFVLIPWAMYFLGTAFTPEQFKLDVRVEYYFTFLTALSVALAATFQLPVLMTFVARLGLVEPATMARYRGHFIVVTFVAAAILTPPDPFTQSMLALPTIALYEIGLLAARYAARPREVP